MTQITNRLDASLASISGEAHDLAERIRSQLQFAESLCELNPESASTWQGLITQAAILIQDSARGGVSEMRETVSTAAGSLGPLCAAAEERTSYLRAHVNTDRCSW